MSRDSILPLLLAGCTYALPSPCDEAACAPYACVAGVCEATCDRYSTSEGYCALGYVCDEYDACIPACDDSDCGGHLRCDDFSNTCRTDCIEDSDCVSGFECCNSSDDCNRLFECIRR